MADNVKIVQCVTTADGMLDCVGEDGTTYTIQQLDMGTERDQEEGEEIVQRVELVFADESQDRNEVAAAVVVPTPASTSYNDGSVMPNEAVLLLISLMPDCMAKKSMSKTMKQKHVWEMIKKEFVQHDYHYTSGQIRNKWKTLERAYKRLLIPRKNGAPRTSCPFQSELDDVFAKHPNLMPSLGMSVGEDKASDDEGTTPYVYDEEMWSLPINSPSRSTTPQPPQSQSPSPPPPPSQSSHSRLKNKIKTKKNVEPPTNSTPKGKRLKVETAITELVALRKQMAENFAKKREDAQQRHREKMELLKQLLRK